MVGEITDRRAAAGSRRCRWRAAWIIHLLTAPQIDVTVETGVQAEPR
jgi:hypothetical protein